MAAMMMCGDVLTRTNSDSNSLYLPRSMTDAPMVCLWTTAMPPPLRSVDEPWKLCNTQWFAGAMSNLIASGASDGIHVSVTTVMSSWRSAITSWMCAALLTADLAFSRPMFTDELSDVPVQGSVQRPPQVEGCWVYKILTESHKNAPIKSAARTPRITAKH